MTEKLKKFEHWFFLFTLAVLFLRAECFDFRIFSVKIALSSVRNLMLILSAVFLYRNFLGWVWREKSFSLRGMDSRGWAGFAFIGFAVLSVVFSTDIAVSLSALKVLTVYIVFYFLIREHAQIQLILKMLALLSAVAGLSALVWRFGVAGGDVDVIESFPFWPGKNAHGLFFAMCSVVFAGLSLKGEGTVNERMLWTGAAVIDFAALVFSYSRGSWIAFACGAGFLLFNVLRMERRNIVYAVVTGAALLCGLLVMAFPDSGLSRRIMKTSPGRDLGVNERIVIWKGASRMIAHNPLLGVGLGQFYYVHHASYHSSESRYDWKDTHYHAHNLFLQIASEVGLPGAVAFVLFFYWALIAIIRSRGNGAILGAALIVFCVYSVFDSSFNARFSHSSSFHVTLIALMFLSLGLKQIGSAVEGETS